jgi:ornithine cyclodeaminase/alanine dehydrogenase-like protein (mu-crystallin family)
VDLDAAVRDMLVIGDEDVRRLMPPPVAMNALESAMRDGRADTGEPLRSVLPLGDGDGSLLVMPSSSAAWLGIKVLSALASPSPHRPAIVGTYMLIDPETATVSAIIDGTSLTAVRTSAVSALALRGLMAPGSDNVVVIGTGAQARAHVRTLSALDWFSSFTVVGRDAARAKKLASDFGDKRVSGIGKDDASTAIRRADVVVCCTSASEPLFDGALVKPSATVVAVGSYTLNARELDEHLLGRSTVYVESIETALAEAGDIHHALDAGVLSVAELRTLPQLIGATHPVDFSRPRVFKSCGVAWQDLAVASELVQRWRDDTEFSRP